MPPTTRRAPGRPKQDPAAEAARQAEWQAAQTAPVVTPAADVVTAPPVVEAAAAPAVPQVGPVPAPQALGTYASSETLSPVVVEEVAPVPPLRLDERGEPAEVRDVYKVLPGCMDPVDDAHRPPRESSVLVETHGQLTETGAWMTVPGGTQIVTTRDVLRVWWPMGSVSPSYSLVARQGVLLPKPALGSAA